MSEIKKHYFKPLKNVKNLSDAELEKWAEEIIDFLIEKDKENKQKDTTKSGPFKRFIRRLNGFFFVVKNVRPWF